MEQEQVTTLDEKFQSLENKQRCSLCEARQIVRDVVRWKSNIFSRCKSCGLVFQDGDISEEENKKYFKEEYYENLQELLPQIQEARKGIYRHVLKDCEPYRRSGRVLDIGAGHGGFMEYARSCGWDAWGIEPSKEAYDVAVQRFGDKMLNQTAEDAQFEEGFFDVITLWNVVDCLPTPKSTLAQISRWLGPEGVLVIRTPNAGFHYTVYRVYAALKPLLKKIGWSKETTVFLRQNFTPKSLSLLFENHGFSQIEIKNGIPTAGDPYKVFSKWDPMQWIKSAIYSVSQFVSFLSFGKLLIGSNMVAFASKKEVEAASKAKRLKKRIALKKVILHVLACLGYMLLLPLWKKLAGKKEIPVLLYHSVDDQLASDLAISRTEFDRHLSFFTENMKVVSLEEACKKREISFFQENELVITFDDGYQDNYYNAFPLLKKYEVPATIFVLAEQRERLSLHLKDPQNHPTKLLSWDQMREMMGKQIEIGSHGLSHKRLTLLDENQLHSEIEGSKEVLEKELGKKVKYFSYPYGTSCDVSQTIKNNVKQAGYAGAVTANYGVNDISVDDYMLRRVGVEASDTLFTLKAKLNGALDLLKVFGLPAIRNLIRWWDRIFLRAASAEGEKPLLVVSADFPPFRNGVSRVSGNLTEGLIKTDHPVVVIGPEAQGDALYDSSRSYTSLRFFGYDMGVIRFIPIAINFLYAVIKYRVRHVFAMNIAYGGVLSYLLSRVMKFEYLIYGYGYEFEKVKNNVFVRKFYLSIYKASRKVIVCSSQVRDRLEEFGVSPDKIEVLYPGVDLEEFNSEIIPQDKRDFYLAKSGVAHKKILLTIGRLVERKGHDYVLKALPEVLKKFPDLVYCIVGGGEYEQSLRDLAAQLNIQESVAFLGRVSEEEIKFLYDASDVFVMPSREIESTGHIEGFGIVYLEANAYEKPVIGGRSGGVVDAVADGESGFLVNPESVEEIRDKILFLLKNPEESKRMGRFGRERIGKLFFWESYAQRSLAYLVGDNNCES